MSVEVRTADGIAEVVIDFPPVNALPVQGWFDLAAAVAAAGADAETRAVILAAAGRGFCAGVDIKEMQRTQSQQGGHEALLGANRGCAAAFAAVYDCPVPVIAAVHGFCLGSGVSIAGNADIVVASNEALGRLLKDQYRVARPIVLWISTPMTSLQLRDSNPRASASSGPASPSSAAGSASSSSTNSGCPKTKAASCATPSRPPSRI